MASVFANPRPALLALADGTLMEGIGAGVAVDDWGEAVGEVVFNTAMSGYQEVLTDPSYHRQLVCFTCPHIGNVGCNEDDRESKLSAGGLIAREISLEASNYRASENLESFLRRQGLPAIHGLDTRRLTRLLRDRGCVNGCIQVPPVGRGLDPERALQKAVAAPSMAGLDLATEVSGSAGGSWSQGSVDPVSGPRPPPSASLKVVVVDTGVKHHILRCLRDVGCEVELVPAAVKIEHIRRLRADGVLLANGPGDPEAFAGGRRLTAELVAEGLPLFGICLGMQLLALALGGASEKMAFGHHGSNHPVLDIADKRVLISSQNHGFVVREDSLPAEVEVTHRSLFDGSLQGFRSRERCIMAFQGHPEASPGPHDAAPLFQAFVSMMRGAAAKGLVHA